MCVCVCVCGGGGGGGGGVFSSNGDIYFEVVPEFHNNHIPTCTSCVILGQSCHIKVLHKFNYSGLIIRAHALLSLETTWLIIHTDYTDRV